MTHTPEPGKTWIDNTVLDQLATIGTTVFAVFAILARHADQAGYCFPSVNRIAAAAGISQRHARRAIATLVDAGLVTRSDRVNEKGVRTANGYRLLTPQKPPGQECPIGQGRPGDPDTGVLYDPDTGVRGTRTPVSAEGLPIEGQTNRRTAPTHNGRFQPPSLPDVEAYCRDRGNAVNPQAFLDYYEARGWKLKGNVPVKDWQACVRTWERNDAGNQTGNGKPKRRPMINTVNGWEEAP